MAQNTVHFTLMHAAGPMALIRTNDPVAPILKAVRKHFKSGSPELIQLTDTDGKISVIRLSNVAAVLVTDGSVTAAARKKSPAAKKKAVSIKRAAARKASVKKIA